MFNFRKVSVGTYSVVRPRRFFLLRRLRRSDRLAVSLGLAACLFLPRSGYSQAPKIVPADVDSGKVQPLDLKPGCWEVRLVDLERIGVNQLEIRPEEIPGFEKTMTPEQLAEFKDVLAALQAIHQKDAKPAGENPQKGYSAANGDQRMACTDAPFAQNGVEAYGTQTQTCQRSVDDSNGVRRIHVLCPGPGGAIQLLADYERIGDGYFMGTRLGLLNGSASIATFAGKWMGEASPHLPHTPPPTDLDGKRPLGPLAVTLLDGFRVVASAQGVQIVAAVAAGAYTGLPANAVKAYGPDPAGEYQQIYLHWSVANDAMNMMLGLQEPWKSQLAAEGLQNVTGSNLRFNLYESGVMSATDRDKTNLGDHAENQKLEEARERILWNAYFSSAKTDAEKNDMLQKAKEKYKVTIIDPDFFSSQTSP